MIEFRDVHKFYDKLHVIRGIDLSITKGEVVVICGPSGSGKSTLIRLVNQLEILSRGDILVDGQSVASLRSRSLRQLRTQIGFVFQQFNLYPHLTAEQNITLALRKVLSITPKDATLRAVELLERVGLADKRQAYPAQLSGGQQQRVAIARTLAMRPKILLFDEPTSALDPEMIGEVLTVMRDLATSGITMLVVTHEMGFARELADLVVFIDQGVILENAKPSDFFLSPQHPRTRQFLRQLLSPLHTAND
ncbi:amino acid ABC transporter ATP-binding protein [Telmatospirillum siberiense]|uniref:Amino acid ABC transporter ATP-binding protein n=1 Tax=Telmatospirillum siberiense TaxID=382514 RepID=A0A2N3PX30_9PROT|nr:amino acid ABC transporter ATP-binding protein [Telmatospirillum siberiense]PKU24947.1 amino acid ABC transporter ATP-binding protein [Telmatospirillum siberiense]